MVGLESQTVRPKQTVGAASSRKRDTGRHNSEGRVFEKRMTEKRAARRLRSKETAMGRIGSRLQEKKLQQRGGEG